MESSSSRVEFSLIPTESLSPNPWNPNAMDPADFRKLKAEIKERGFKGAVLARPHPPGYQIVDGEHRWRIARELGLAEVPCMVSQMDEREARIKTLQMNGLRGENNPDALARLLSDLRDYFSADELSKCLPWSSEEINQIVAAAAKDAPECLVKTSLDSSFSAPTYELFHLVLTGGQTAAVEKALQLALDNCSLTGRGDALAEVCGHYIECQRNTDRGPKGETPHE